MYMFFVTVLFPLSDIKFWKCHFQWGSTFQKSDTNFNLHNSDFMIPRFNTITFGKHSIKYLGLYPQHKLPIALRTLTQIDKCKKKLGKVIWLLTWRKINVGGNAPYVTLESFLLCIYEIFVLTVIILVYCSTYILFIS